MECSAERDAAFAEKRTSSSSSSEAPAPTLSPYDEAATCGCQLLDLSVVGRQVVVELKTSNALPLLKYACSNRTVALPTSQLNAQRVSASTQPCFGTTYASSTSGSTVLLMADIDFMAALKAVHT